MIDEDLDAFLEDHGKPCQCGAVDFLGIVDAPDENLSMGGGMNALSQMTTVMLKTSVVVAAGIKLGVGLVVDGVPYMARQPVRVDDGAFSSIPLTKVTP